MQEAPLNLEPLQASDLAELKVLQDVLFPVKYSADFYQSLLKPNAVSVVSFKDDKMIAVATARIMRKQGYIATLGVDPQFQSQGIGRRLLRSFCERLEQEDIDRIVLHVHTENTKAIRLYESEGFSIKEELRAHYYYDGTYHDAFRLEKELKTSNCILL